MKIMPTLICAAVVAAGAAASAGAQTVVDVSKIKCEDFLTASPNAIETGIWLSGYYNGLRKNTKLDYSQLKSNADAVVAECRADPKKTVMQAADKLLAKKKQ